ncbi:MULTISPECIES: pyridoxal-phosphate-dependent aminotransferase family protein [Gemella]|uniref:pyridoxal-phosphate-dependent aminotransferase family protein n=1 Tax=Gemella TaxID=1378 RepID=UPI00093013B0|nr:MULTISPECIES: aminotransferase class V-fold PLP-dependent enzyme [Gemella]AXI26449.1 alanine--glyoxylate aminotransferase family protein [Gemella sp. ND 6198]
MINFSVGPVHLTEEVMEAYGDIPYFRTNEFSDIMLENEKLVKELTNASDNDRVIFLTGSGTAGMESSVINTLTLEDKILIINGGSFGTRFAEICSLKKLNYEEIVVGFEEILTLEKLEKYSNKNFTALVVNLDETSIGKLYDIELISKFCKENNLFLIVDAISAFLADEIDVTKHGIDVLIIGSQKALACPPGVAIIVLSERAIDRIKNINHDILYFDFKKALKDGERGQTPFTPAVGILLQLNARLKQISSTGGVEAERKKIEKLANDFRGKVKELPLTIPQYKLSNTVTPLLTNNCSAKDIFNILKDEYKIWVCPNGGELGEKLFRVGHIGNLSVEKNNELISALYELKERNILK